ITIVNALTLRHSPRNRLAPYLFVVGRYGARILDRARNRDRVLWLGGGSCGHYAIPRALAPHLRTGTYLLRFCSPEDVIDPPAVGDALQPSVRRRNCKLYWYVLCSLGLCFFSLPHAAASALQLSCKSTQRRSSVETK